MQVTEEESLDAFLAGGYDSSTSRTQGKFWQATQAHQAPHQRTIETYLTASRFSDPKAEADMPPIALRISTPAHRTMYKASEQVVSQLSTHHPR